MSDTLSPKPRLVGPKVRICIVASKYNEKFTDALVENAANELEEVLPNARVDTYRVPGAYEIPVIVSSIIKTDPPTVVIALGLIMRGATGHAELIGQSVTHSLQQIAVDTLVPVIHEVLLVKDEKQAQARCIGAQLNRGREAARSAVSMIEVSHEATRATGRALYGKK